MLPTLHQPGTGGLRNFRKLNNPTPMSLITLKTILLLPTLTFIIAGPVQLSRQHLPYPSFFQSNVLAPAAGQMNEASLALEQGYPSLHGSPAEPTSPMAAGMNTGMAVEDAATF